MITDPLIRCFNHSGPNYGYPGVCGMTMEIWRKYYAGKLPQRGAVSLGGSAPRNFMAQSGDGAGAVGTVPGSEIQGVGED